VYNLRYHIASLVAVFLALAVGLLLGTIIVQNGALKSGFTTQVQGLTAQFNQIRSESAALTRSNTVLSSYATEALPRVLDSALASRTVLVIASPDTADTVAQVTADVKAAGAGAAIATFNDVGLSLGQSAVAAAVGKALGTTADSVDETSVITELAREWSTRGDGRVLTKALVASGALKLTGLGANTIVDGTVVADTFDGKPDPSAFRLASAMTDTLRPAVGVETTKRSDGTAAAAKAAGLSGVDDIDTPMGETSLVWVLAGRATGLYGAGDTVDGPFPSPLFPAP
jgi:hypothetical protein